MLGKYLIYPIFWQTKDPLISPIFWYTKDPLIYVPNILSGQRSRFMLKGAKPGSFGLALFSDHIYSRTC
jgi:hypothetical protein